MLGRQLVAEVALKNGDDLLYLDDRTAHGSIFALGGGEDELIHDTTDIYAQGFTVPSIVVDLDGRRFDYGDPGSRPDARLRGVDRLVLAATEVAVNGSQHTDHIEVGGCHVLAAGRGGADRLVVSELAAGYCENSTTRLRGGGVRPAAGVERH
jgi:hypothetical protein